LLRAGDLGVQQRRKRLSWRVGSDHVRLSLRVGVETSGVDEIRPDHHAVVVRFDDGVFAEAVPPPLAGERIGIGGERQRLQPRSTTRAQRR
jgi:hypothetical protein